MPRMLPSVPSEMITARLVPMGTMLECVPTVKDGGSCAPVISSTHDTVHEKGLPSRTPPVPGIVHRIDHRTGREKS